MSRYIATPVDGTTFDVTEVSTGTALKTLLQVKPVSTDIRVLGWGVSFDGVTAGDPPGRVQLLNADVAATVTSLTPQKWGNANAQASLCVGGTTATGFNATAEGTITASAVELDGQDIHPQTGYSCFWWDMGPIIAAGRFLRIRTLFSVSVNGVPWILYQEPVE